MDSLSPVLPIRPVAPYIGGKKALAKRLNARIAAVSHDTYAEVFVGMGGVFLRRDRRPKAEVINDFSHDVANFFRVVRHHYQAFMNLLDFQITSRDEFERLKATDPDTLTDMQRAARFLYLQCLAFGGKVAGRNFGVSVGRPGRFNVNKLAADLADLNERLAAVVIERLDWSEFIRRYDRKGTLFYLDPPYFGCEGDYGRDLFDRSQFVAMAGQLRRIEGRFILSLNDTPEVREIFAGFNFEAVGVRYTVSGGGNASMAKEVIISN